MTDPERRDPDRDRCPRCGEAWRKRALLAEAKVERLIDRLQSLARSLRVGPTYMAARQIEDVIDEWLYRGGEE